MRTGYGHMVHDDYVARVRVVHARRQARLQAIRTREEALAYQQEVRQSLKRIFAPRPPKTPLNVRVTGVNEHPAYRVEKLLFDSRPGYTVAANLYLPHNLSGPAPAVLGTCGHSAEGKALPLYQAFCVRLALAGFVVLIYDPVNQGERDQYALLQDRQLVESCTHAHNMMGKQLELIGENLTMWRTWDGIRALDYLLSRPEVDPARVGVTGNSGGGTMTTWLWGVEERFSMAAPSCFVTTTLHNLENELPADAEQYPPGLLAAGLELADFLIARAPQPALLLGQQYDYFDRRGLRQAAEEVRRFYALLGNPDDDFGCFIGPHGHGYWRENQEAMLDFFTAHAGLPQPAKLPDEELLVSGLLQLEPESLWATPSGNVVQAGATPIYTLIAHRAEKLQAARPPLTPDALRNKLAELLHLPARQGAPHHRNLRPARLGETTYARYAVETEGNIRAILHKKLADPEHAYTLDVAGEAHLYLPHFASEEDLLAEPLALALQEQHELYALDVRGLGESLPDEEGSFWQPYGLDYMFHGYGLLLGQSYLGQRVWDVLRTTDLLLDQGAQQVHLYGRGQGALLALFAAMLHPQVATLTLKNGPRSFREWIDAPIVRWPSANFLWNALAWFDLPDCLAALGDRVTIIEPWDAQMQSVEDTDRV
ncbi:MAG: prolyl oligopeptidase family serine peptidase [Chloroflexi bacterium]|nr:prolyl oligopeptidase family serine peptidase [Chloroflexota bacterium]